MKPIFIELTYVEGKKFKGNICLLQRYSPINEVRCYVVGWNNNGGFEVLESYEEVTKLIEEALSKN